MTKEKTKKGLCLGCGGKLPKPSKVWKWRWYCDMCRDLIKRKQY